MPDSLPQIAFRHPETAQNNLEHITKRVSPDVRQALYAFLRDSPDPDSVLNLFERFVETANPQIFKLLERHLLLVHYVVAIFGYSHYLGETLIQNTNLMHALARDKNLERSLSRDDYRENFARFRSRSFENDIATLLARFKKREYVRIVLQDVLGAAHLADTTAELSALADVLLEEALREVQHSLHARYGRPQTTDADGRLTDIPVSILSMGKLGGNEVNYSSDVDLLYLYGDGDAPEGRAISNREYFIRLAQNVTEVLSRPNKEGPVFRIDLRLRPQGGEGELAVSLAAALRYYQNTAHDWELQALLKVRHSAGDVELSRKFVRAVQRHVYSEKLNFAAIETALNSLEKISSRRRHAKALHTSERATDVKIDRGGIRDIEFLVQCLQRVYGGVETWLRSGGTLFSLQKLHDKAHITSKDYQALTSAYTILRRVEHRLQLRRGQQTHRLPASEDGLKILCASMVERGLEPLPPERFLPHIRQLMENVAVIYDRVVHSEQQHRDEPAAYSQFVLSPTVGSAQEATFQQVLDRIAADSSELYEIASRDGLSPFARRNLHRFLSAALTTADRYAVVLQSPKAVERALEVFHVSGYLSDVLARHPEVLSAFASAAPDGGGQLFVDSAPTEPVANFFAGIAAADVSYKDKMDLLRQRFRQKIFESAVRDVVHPDNVYLSLEQNSVLCEMAVRTAVSIAGAEKDFAVLGLGRLGTREFDWGSDADLLFVRTETLSVQAANELAGKVVELLATYTRFGNLCAVDARLRPHGGEGELVVTPEMLHSYFATEALPWEALTYTKLRFLAGDAVLGERAHAAVFKASERFACDQAFVVNVRQMRLRLERAEIGTRSLKSSVGGFYDVDFILSLKQVKHKFPDAAMNTRMQIYALAERKRLTRKDAHILDDAAELMRATDHAIRLVTGRSRKWLPENENARAVIQDLVHKMTGRPLQKGLEQELTTTFASVRTVFDRLISA